MGKNSHSKTTTGLVAVLMIVLFYYLQKDVERQIDKLILEQETTGSAYANQPLPPCPKSKYEGGTFHSQYYEDYILSYVFNDVTKGVFLDIGAAHPTRNNMTYLFYQKGWRGISIDPIPAYQKLYDEKRSGDLFINIGVSETESTLTFFHCGHQCELGTFDKEIAEFHKQNGGIHFNEMQIPVRPISQVLKAHPKKHIHFANVDVEGWEQSVLKSFDFKNQRPEIFVIESTKPKSEAPNFKNWEPTLISNGYMFAMTDYLNRYYVDLSSPNLTSYLQRLNYIDMCVRHSKIEKNTRPTSWDTDLR